MLIETKLSDELWCNYNMSIISKSSKFLNKKGANQCPIIPTGHVSDINWYLKSVALFKDTTQFNALSQDIKQLHFTWYQKQSLVSIWNWNCIAIVLHQTISQQSSGVFFGFCYYCIHMYVHAYEQKVSVLEFQCTKQSCEWDTQVSAETQVTSTQNFCTCISLSVVVIQGNIKSLLNTTHGSGRASQLENAACHTNLGFLSDLGACVDL